MLAGGPNENLEDPYASNVLAGTAPALCYADSDQAYSLNEVAIYWNSPAIFLFAYIMSAG
jgi:endoglucanase